MINFFKGQAKSLTYIIAAACAVPIAYALVLFRTFGADTFAPGFDWISHIANNGIALALVPCVMLPFVLMAFVAARREGQAAKSEA